MIGDKNQTESESSNRANEDNSDLNKSKLIQNLNQKEEIKSDVYLNRKFQMKIKRNLLDLNIYLAS